MVIPEWDTAGGPEAAAVAGADPRAAEASLAAESQEPGPLPEVPADGVAETGAADPQRLPETGPAGATTALLADISVSLKELAGSAERYHTRAEQREAVIDHQRDEVDRLRRGERRGLLRPLLVEICRLRNDLLRQAGELPAGFGAERAALLLQSYAESIDLTLENSGVRTFAPESGDPFDPRMHRRVGREPTDNPALAGRIANIRRDGYLDVDSNSPIAPAEVMVFGIPAGTPATESSADKRNEQ